jgi:hypothetical protein
MSWHDPARHHESAEDRDLRGELSQILGLPARGFFAAEPTAKMIALAEDLRREALRRRHTSRQRPFRMLLAAGLPLALAVGGIASWGYQHKQRADALAAAVAQKEIELQNLAHAAPATPAAQAQVSAPLIAANAAPRGKVKVRPNGELVLEVKPYQTPTLDTQPVKGQ